MGVYGLRGYGYCRSVCIVGRLGWMVGLPTGIFGTVSVCQNEIKYSVRPIHSNLGFVLMGLGDGDF